jgi:signal transduction histidine kinase
MKEFSHPGPVERQAIDLNHAIESTILVASHEWKYVADVSTDLDPDLYPVRGLAGEINQVMLNLIVNAAHAISDLQKAPEEKGRIDIRTRQDGEFAEIRVSDTGCGIPESIQSKIFDPFFTTKPVGKGTGQGLALAYAVIVKKHNGTIRVESKPGQGTTFVIRLPLNS